uniref:Uncharacterized protein MANES_12G130500 n=1 Tax=Rhizophora mucronata TaxID=61149 RepID=A0A2P2JJ61_RHIMU
MAGGQPHPYVPRDMELKEYVPGKLSQSTILSVYGLSSLLVISLVWLFSGFLLLTFVHFFSLVIHDGRMGSIGSSALLLVYNLGKVD